MFLVGLAIFTLSSAACALATNDHQLIIARADPGLRRGAHEPAVALDHRDRVPAQAGRDRDRHLGRHLVARTGARPARSAASSSTRSTGPPCSGSTCRSAWSPRPSPCTPSTSRGIRPRTTLDIVGTVLVTAGLFALVYGLIKTNTHAWLSTFTLGWLGGGDRAARRASSSGSPRQANPMVPLGFFKKSSFDASAIVVAFVGFSLFGIIFFLDAVLPERARLLGAGRRRADPAADLHDDGRRAARGQAQPEGRPARADDDRHAAHLGRRSSRSARSACTPRTPWMIVPAYVAMGIGIAMTMPTTASTAMGSVSPDKAGIASGVVNASRQVGGALGIADPRHGRCERRDEPVEHVRERRARGSRSRRSHALTDARRRRPVAQDRPASSDRRRRTPRPRSFVHGLNAAMYVGGALTLARRSSPSSGSRASRRPGRGLRLRLRGSGSDCRASPSRSEHARRSRRHPSDTGAGGPAL